MPQWQPRLVWEHLSSALADGKMQLVPCPNGSQPQPSSMRAAKTEMDGFLPQY
ncbi:Hypothetical predicted protein [Podarcis lilfordi]|uniref:Uncharacterized protein n=1 Tax=Podarcis lilfordi TaxID=74358 RepID=A0AA35L6Y7_9SAUR|nr:Hypothetical predicted protein [Podarcis lilfordi]